MPLASYAFAPSQLAILARPNGAGYTPQNGAQALQSGALAVLNGPMFAFCSGEAERVTASHPDCAGNCRYRYAACDRLDYLHFDAGANLSDPGRNATGVTLAVVDGRAGATPGASVPEGASVAVQLYPTLVLNGAAQPTAMTGSNLESVWRSALAILADGSLAFVVAQMTMQGFAQALAASGVVAAGYTDGGGSTMLATADGARTGSSENRMVASWLAAMPAREGENAPNEAVPSGGVVAAVVTVAAALLGWLLWPRDGDD